MLSSAHQPNLGTSTERIADQSISLCILQAVREQKTAQLLLGHLLQGKNAETHSSYKGKIWESKIIYMKNMGKMCL